MGAQATWKERAGGEAPRKDKVRLGGPPMSRDLQPPHGPRQQRKQEASQNRPGAAARRHFPAPTIWLNRGGRAAGGRGRGGGAWMGSPRAKQTPTVTQRLCLPGSPSSSADSQDSAVKARVLAMRDMSQVRLREVKRLIQGHTAGKRQS